MSNFTIYVHLKGGGVVSTVSTLADAEQSIQDWVNWQTGPRNPADIIRRYPAFAVLIGEIAAIFAVPYKQPVQERQVAAVEKMVAAVEKQTDEGEDWRSPEE